MRTIATGLAFAAALTCTPRVWADDASAALPQAESAPSEPTNAPAPPTAPPGTVTIVLESQGAPLAVDRVRDAPPPAPPSEYLREALCRTPCRVALPPGVLELYASGPGLRATLFSLEVPATGARVRLHAGRSAPFAAGFALSLAGLALVATGPVLFALAPPSRSAADPTPFFATGGALLGVGAATGIAGLVLLLTNPVGLASMQPL